MTTFFDPFDFRGLSLRPPNRSVRPPMTRTRATETGVTTDLLRGPYVQRAAADLMVTECIQVSGEGHGILRCLWWRGEASEGWAASYARWWNGSQRGSLGASSLIAKEQPKNVVQFVLSVTPQPPR